LLGKINSLFEVSCVLGSNWRVFWAFFVGAQFLAHMAFSDNTTDRYKQLNWGFGDQVTTMALLDTGWLPCKQPISIFCQ